MSQRTTLKESNSKSLFAFYQKSKSRYVSTVISVPISEWNFDTQTSTNKLIQIKIYEQIASYQKQIQQLEVLDIEPTLDKIIDKPQCCANSLLADYFKQVISYLKSVDKFGTVSKYKATLSLLHIARFRVQSQWAITVWIASGENKFRLFLFFIADCQKLSKRWGYFVAK